MTSNHQTWQVSEYWNLEFLWMLVVGIWNFEIVFD